jgi:hypothetical protein
MAYSRRVHLAKVALTVTVGVFFLYQLARVAGFDSEVISDAANQINGAAEDMMDSMKKTTAFCIAYANTVVFARPDFIGPLESHQTDTYFAAGKKCLLESLAKSASWQTAAKGLAHLSNGLGLTDCDVEGACSFPEPTGP